MDQTTWFVIVIFEPQVRVIDRALSLLLNTIPVSLPIIGLHKASGRVGVSLEVRAMNDEEASNQAQSLIQAALNKAGPPFDSWPISAILTEMVDDMPSLNHPVTADLHEAVAEYFASKPATPEAISAKILPFARKKNAP